MAENSNPISNIQIIQQAQAKSGKFFSNLINFRIVLLILGITILIELILGIRLLFTPVPTASAALPISGGKITLVADKTGYAVGEEIKVIVRVGTGGHNTNGTDVVIKYDPQAVEVNEANGIVAGDLYTEYPILKTDAGNGIVQISGISPADYTGFNGLGEFATLNLRAKSLGQATLSIEYKPNTTTDSNIIDSADSNDILAQVENLKITVDNESSHSLLGINPSCSGYNQVCIDENGHEGVQFCEGGTKNRSNNQCSFDPLETTFCGNCEIK